VVTAQPDNTRAHLGLARVFFEQGQWASALANARTVLNASGSNFQALFVGGRAAKLTGEPEAAQEYFDRADKMLEQSIEANPQQPESYYLRGETQFAAGDYGKAYEHFTAAESRTAQNKTYSAYGEQFNLADVYVKLGLCMQRLGNPDRAKRFGEQALEIAPDNRLAQSLCEREN
jgi:tetratricopeptide (TPR) repeat protein